MRPGTARRRRATSLPYGAAWPGPSNRGSPSSGIRSHGTAELTHWRYCGRMPGFLDGAQPHEDDLLLAGPAEHLAAAVQAVPLRLAVGRLPEAEPILAGGDRKWARPSSALAAQEVPVRCWQRWQWQ